VQTLARPNNKKESKKDEDQEHVIMCPADWSDPEYRRILGEFHKGQPEDLTSLDSEMKAFENVWTAQSRPKLAGEYHKEGAPFLGWSEQGTVPLPPSAQSTEDYHKMLKEKGVPESAPKEASEPMNIRRSIDLGTVEIITYAMFRTIFGRGVKVPIKREGMMDMDVIVRGKDIILNTNQLFFVVPDLAVWRIIYSHKGTPVMEFGRGVDKGIKVHRMQAIRLAFEIWKDSKKTQKNKAKLRAALAKKAEEEVAE
jgi:hypothetical protein